jgi:hypothetical protein
MMLGVLQTNRQNTLEALRKFQTQLAEIESALASEDFPKLESLLNQSRSSHQVLTATDN